MNSVQLVQHQYQGDYVRIAQQVKAQLVEENALNVQVEVFQLQAACVRIVQQVKVPTQILLLASHVQQDYHLSVEEYVSNVRRVRYPKKEDCARIVQRVHLLNLVLQFVSCVVMDKIQRKEDCASIVNLDSSQFKMRPMAVYLVWLVHPHLLEPIHVRIVQKVKVQH